MSGRRREAALATVTALAAGAAVTLSVQEVGDYAIALGPAVRSLTSGNLGDILGEALPSTGLTPVLLGSPFAAVAPAGDLLGEYRLFVLPVAWAAGLLGAAVWLTAGRRGIAAAAAATLCLLNPLTFDALRWGHPEELLAAVLAVGAVAAAAETRPLWAGVLLGLAVGTETWSLLAAPAVLLAASAQRWRLLAVATALGAALALPTTLAAPESLGPAITGSSVFPTSIWWPLAEEEAPGARRSAAVGEYVSERFYMASAGVTRAARGTTTVALAALLLLAARRRGTRWGADALALLALMLLVVASMRETPFGYFFLPFLLALVCWEALAERRFPLLSCGVAAALWLTFIEDSLVRGSDPRVYAFTLAWVLPTAAYLGVRCLRSGPRDARPGEQEPREGDGGELRPRARG